MIAATNNVQKLLRGEWARLCDEDGIFDDTELYINSDDENGDTCLQYLEAKTKNWYIYETNA
mgnify:CR=1 FL=1